MLPGKGLLPTAGNTGSPGNTPPIGMTVLRANGSWDWVCMVKRGERTAVLIWGCNGEEHRPGVDRWSYGAGEPRVKVGPHPKEPEYLDDGPHAWG